MTEAHVPAALLAAVRGDLRPVRPLPAPWRRTLRLLPLGLVLLLGQPLLWGFRSNLDRLGGAASWGFSIAEAVGGLLAVGAALREAVPGRVLSRATLASAVLAALALLLGVTFVTAHVLPTTVPPGVAWRFVWECWGMAGLAGLPVLALLGWLCARVLAGRPAVAGALYGLGAGLMVDAGVRLFCWVSSPAHVLIAHGGAVLGFAALGAAVSATVERVRR
jgi:hypothetical protein